MRQIFPFTKAPILNHLSGAPYTMRRMLDIEATEAFLQSVVSICNEPKVYDWLFRQRLGGAPYPRADAVWFKEWGDRGWREGTHYLFIVQDADGHAAAACDIKSAKLDGAEIGYWSSERHRGIMTNAVNAMIAAGFAAGYRRLYGRVRKGNSSSAAVLLRCGLTPADGSDDIYDVFDISAPKTHDGPG